MFSSLHESNIWFVYKSFFTGSIINFYFVYEMFEVKKRKNQCYNFIIQNILNWTIFTNYLQLLSSFFPSSYGRSSDSILGTNHIRFTHLQLFQMRTAIQNEVHITTSRTFRMRFTGTIQMQSLRLPGKA